MPAGPRMRQTARHRSFMCQRVFSYQHMLLILPNCCFSTLIPAGSYSMVELQPSGEWGEAFDVRIATFGLDANGEAVA